MHVIVLNADYTFLSSVSWKRALKLVFKGKVEVLKHSEKVISGFRESIKIPQVIRLIKFVRQVFKNRVPLSRKNIFIRDEYICQYCGRNCKGNPTIDHIIPKSRGGEHSWKNSVTACSQCNHKKGSQTPKEAKMGLLKVPIRPTINEFAQKKLKLLGLEDILTDLWKEAVH